MPNIKLFFIFLFTVIYTLSLTSCTSRVSSGQYKVLGYSELALAIKESNLPKTKQLVSLGSDIHKVATIRNHTSLADQNQPALQLAVEQFLYERSNTKRSTAKQNIVKYLLEQGADARGPRYTNKKLNFYDHSGALVSIIEPFRSRVPTQSRTSLPSSNAQIAPTPEPVSAAPAPQSTSEIEQMKMEIARLKAQLATKNRLRTALVIGNSRYSYAPLNNPVNDAQDIAKTLKSLNFDVTLRVNTSLQDMETSIDNFTRTLHHGGIGLFYYAGHGVQSNGDNYLIPINAQINNQAAVKYEAVSLSRVLESMGDAKNFFNIAIIDACRNNPLPRSSRSSGARGLARINSPSGTLLAFSTSPGKIASDGNQRNGLYTKFLLKHMTSKNTPIELMLKRVARDVKKASGNKQTPWMESSFTDDFSF